MKMRWLTGNSRWWQLAAGACLCLVSSGSEWVPAQDVGSPVPPPYRAERRSDFNPTRTVKGMLIGISHERMSLTVLDRKEGASFALFFPENAKVKASRKVRKALGKKKTSWQDLKPGFQIEVKFLELNREVLEIKLLKVET